MNANIAPARSIPRDARGREDALREAAERVRDRAYAPYSNFRVGAALLGTDGSVAACCNVENASFGAGICAERAALAALIAQGTRSLELLVIVTDAKDPTPPCGLCRQVFIEFAPALPVVSFSAGGGRAQWTLDALLPSPFTPDSLHNV